MRQPKGDSPGIPPLEHAAVAGMPIPLPPPDGSPQAPHTRKHHGLPRDQGLRHDGKGRAQDIAHLSRLPGHTQQVGVRVLVRSLVRNMNAQDGLHQEVPGQPRRRITLRIAGDPLEEGGGAQEGEPPGTAGEGQSCTSGTHTAVCSAIRTS